jgi:hypothetical protein
MLSIVLVMPKILFEVSMDAQSVEDVLGLNCQPGSPLVVMEVAPAAVPGKTFRPESKV